MTLPTLARSTLKGVDRKLRLYRADAPTGAGVRFDVARDQGLLPLVNRDRERNLLAGAWRGCQAGNGQALLIEGEPGIGKSRLVHFARQLAQGSGQVLEIAGSPYQRRSASRAVSRAMRQFLGLDGLAPGDRYDAMARRVAALQIDDPLALPLLADFLDVMAPEASAARKLEPAQARSATFDAVCALVGKIAGQHPC